MPMFTIISDEGTPYVGGPAVVDLLDEPYKSSVLEQIKNASAGLPMSAVKVPEPVLIRAGFMSKAEFLADKEGDAPAFEVEETKPMPRRVANSNAPKPQPPKNPCDGCPFKDVAMKIIDKTLEGLK